MRKLIFRLPLLAIILGILTGCGAHYNPSFTKMSSGYAQYLAQYQTDSILMNLIRASEEKPLSFLDIPSINGSGSTNQNHSMGLSLGGLAADNFSGAIVSASPSSSVGVATSFNFTQSSLDNATFWKGFLSQIPIRSAGMFRTQHIPREVLFSLLIESIEIRLPNQEPIRYFNSPLDANYQKFTEVFYTMLDEGLEIEPIVSPAPSTKTTSTSGKDKNAQPSSPPSPQSSGQLVQDFQICLKHDPNRSNVKRSYHADHYCGISTEERDLFNGKARFVVRLRSLKNIFNYLGDVINAQQHNPAVFVTLPPTPETKNRKEGQSRRYVLFVVQKNPPSNQTTYASTVGSYGDEYAIPRENNGYSPLVMDLLSNMIILNKISGSFPQQPAVLLR